MKQIISYNQFLNESKSNKFIDSILSAIEPNILKMINDVEHYYVNELKRSFSKLDAESTRLDITYNLIRSLEKYTLPTDTLIDINTTRGRNGTVKISANVQRDDKSHKISTDVIVAGGFIQVNHYRYITKTTLPKTGMSEMTKIYLAKIKKLSKLDKLNKEVNRLQVRVDKFTADLLINTKMTDTAIWKDLLSSGEYKEYTWKEVVGNGADKNYDFDESLFDTKQLERKNSVIANWKYFKIESKEDNIARTNKEIIKLQGKIEKEL